MAPTPQQIQQALDIIEAQLKFLKTALGGSNPTIPVATPSSEEGIVGVFDGEFMTVNTGRRIQVPPNYASKSMLVPGDTIRMIEDPSKDPTKAKFKQIGKVERLKATGMLTRKDGKFEVLTEQGSFKVLTAAIKHYFGEPGDTVTIQFPQNHNKGGYAAVERVAKAGQAVQPPTEMPQAQPVSHVAEPVTSVEMSSKPAENTIPAIENRAETVKNQPKPTSANRSKLKPSNRPQGQRTTEANRPSPNRPRPVASPNPAPTRPVNEITISPSGMTTSGEISVPEPIGEDDLV